MRKMISILLAFTILMILFIETSLASDLSGVYDIVIWVRSEIVDLTRLQVEEFNNTNTEGIVVNANVVSMSVNDSYFNMITDKENSADLYCFTQDQLSGLINEEALDHPDSAATGIIIAENDSGSVAAASYKEKVYAYPMSTDNGYFMYYDKSVIPEGDVDSLEKLISDCEEAGKDFVFEIKTSAWYMASFFFATGCTSEWDVDDGGVFDSVSDTFNSSEGLIAVKGMKKLLNSSCFLNGSDCYEFNNNAAIVVSGSWDYDTARQILGDRLGATDLPSFEVDGQHYHLGSFSGNKLMGVKPQTETRKKAVLHKLAQFLSSEKAQMERYRTAGWGLTNKNDKSTEEVQSNPAIAALFKQAEYGVPQNQIHASWWDIALTIPEGILNAENDTALLEILTKYDEDVHDVFYDHLVFVGSWNDWNMNEQDKKYYLRNGSVTLYIPPQESIRGRIVSPGSLEMDKGFNQVACGTEYLLGSDSDNNLIFAESGLYNVSWDGTYIYIIAMDHLLLPADLTVIESGAFSGNQHVIFVMGDQIENIADDAFDPTATIYAPPDSYAFNRCLELSLNVRER